jgi:hypothetical protein
MDRELGLMPVVSIPDLALAEPPRPGPALRLPAASHSARLALRLRQSPWTLPSLAVLVALVSSLI